MTRAGAQVQVPRWGRIRSTYSIPGALTSQHKYTGQEHIVGGTKDDNRNNLEGVARRDNPKSKKTNVQTKDVEEVIKMWDGIVERRER